MVQWLRAGLPLLRSADRVSLGLFDLEGFGEIPWPDFRNALVHPEFVAAVDLHKREQLAAKSLTPTTTAITFQDFVNVVSIQESLLCCSCCLREVKCSVAQCGCGRGGAWVKMKVMNQSIPLPTFTHAGTQVSLTKLRTYQRKAQNKDV
ncbi:hypothetical protein E2C01_043821 [Portunus trituberculatus]|uniref:Uncharacterized protein n=1 Tax=Portunus trituberculatus TaxID=210409 RepID=A0A5B7FTX7_PORTR|nr:hypothetical protein [Portunus trituberculatus]